MPGNCSSIIHRSVQTVFLNLQNSLLPMYLPRKRNELTISTIYVNSTKAIGYEDSGKNHNISNSSETNSHCSTTIYNGLASSKNRNGIYSLSDDQQRSSITDASNHGINNDVSNSNIGTLDLDASKCSRSGVSLDSKYSFSPTNR